MGLVYLPIFTLKINHSYRQIYDIPMDPSWEVTGSMFPGSCECLQGLPPEVPNGEEPEKTRHGLRLKLAV